MLEVIRELGEVVGLPLEVDLSLHPHGEVLPIEGHGEEVRETRDDVAEQVQNVQVHIRFELHRRVPHFYRDFSGTVPQRIVGAKLSAVYLGHRTAGHWVFVEHVEDILDVSAEGLAHGTPSVLEVVFRRGVAQRLQRRDHVSGEHVRSHGHPLAELQKAAARTFDGPYQHLYGVLAQTLAACEESGRGDDGTRREEERQVHQSPHGDHELLVPWQVVVRVSEGLRFRRHLNVDAVVERLVLGRA
mmetsp:Transcript_119326/g.337551  ORF Transcript_119326/g.337551 Transcript_119326/m.337551 type:complete len:244 (-) Transcript_119326:273-1004(-)